MTALSIPKVLLIESDFVVRRTIGAIAKSIVGIEVAEASNLESAQQKYAASTFDAIVVDLGDGNSALAWLENLGPSAPPTLIMLSHPIDELIQKRLEIFRPTYLLMKPVKMRMVLELLEDMLGLPRRV